MRVWVLAGCVSVLVSLGAAFKIPDFISDLVDGSKQDNKRQDTLPAGVVEQILPATFALTFSASLAQNLIELFLASGIFLYSSKAQSICLHVSAPPADSGYKEGAWPLQTSPVSMLPKFTTVFGVPVFAASSVSVKAILHSSTQ